MACQNYEVLINKYIEGLATFSERDMVQAHIDECVNCRRDVEELEKVVRILNSLEQVEPPRDLMPSLYEKLGDLQQGQSYPHRPSPLERFPSLDFNTMIL